MSGQTEKESSPPKQGRLGVTLRTLTDTESRHASALELFFDLVLAVAIAALGELLARDTSLRGFLRYGALFVPVWWAWVGYTFYADRFETDGVGRRMLGLALQCWRTRGLGDFWQHVLVADGSCDVSMDPIVSYWDAAALLPIVVEAGGRWSTIDGATPALPESLVCTNGLLHDTVVGLLDA